MPPRLEPLHVFGVLLLPVLLIGVLLVSCGGGDDQRSAVSPTPATGAVGTSTPGASATPEPQSATLNVEPTATTASGTSTGAGFEYEGFQILGDFTYAGAVDFPENLMMVVETGCVQCDGPTQALYRVWRNSGETHVDLLADASLSGSEHAYITSFAVGPDLHDIVVTICTQCGEAGPLIDSPVTMYRSIDGGASWRSIYSAPPGNPVFAQAITPDGLVISEMGGALSYFHGDPIEAPDGTKDLLRDTNRSGALRWLTEGGSTAVAIDGSVVAAVEPGSLIDSVAGGADRIREVIGWAQDFVKGPFKGWNVTRIDPDGRLLGFRSDNYVAPVTVLGDGHVLGGMADLDSPDDGAIGFIDPSRGVLTPIHGALVEAPFGDGRHAVGRNTLQGAVSGPFLRVMTGSSCLPIRTGTDVTSDELTCAADGTLVYDLQNTTTVGALQWSRVRLLDGREGYALSDHLSGE